MPTWASVFLFIIMLVAAFLQLVTLRCVKSYPLARAGKNIIFAGFCIAGVRYLDAAVTTFDFTHWILGGIALGFLALGSIAMNLDRIIAESHKRKTGKELIYEAITPAK